MRTDCKKIVVQCARNKPSRHRPYGLLQPLQVPGRPWHSISMDFIEQLSASNGLPLSWWLLTACPRKAFFIPTTDNVTTPDVADAFVSHVLSVAWHPSPCGEWNPPLTSSTHSTPSFECAYTSRQAITPQPTVRQNRSTALWYSTLVCIATTSGTTGPHCIESTIIANSALPLDIES